MMRISAKHQSALKVDLVRTGAKPYRVAPIGTNPHPATGTKKTASRFGTFRESREKGDTP